ncbi:RNA polymerase, sigma-24 subunit, ECF subfamily OS=Tsukamurella paurometabola (strain ATCC 8368 /DSM / CCUG 35730 / CIP 100753 / JCM 10117 / KCTC 9821/ NBRC 16120 / NCIMB 702349 / NCTC 13040) OX=521096 GN=Tpau_0990 PE=3 SV=1 [Tsukamurella paurometabola]|uniref:RNA polymerase, sigma-24 subunit, ECF subfamily n=1 Tax=Tsukamurella paurometabola (strain ATCC 8368 / DSM 20162 / CCUG 35730 / CIP 100753 / JCM 10117 / KCTC 9821 / NBRC 16120 / NCIMB 702349 / NCTC 13040) TaxID=521096 RepID=D5UV33_TSUPD|nr:RNA polymerase sigma-70 factor [Tsukamurella paurometabola]ADG77623.1 RNA polymerase, sigma-24 subunit, ECF subfamily [Tsukamurella paurometabola DSM 20162]SUP27979.1 RNA polymerase sigma factor SigJ [Tsukamurella paurometabola]
MSDTALDAFTRARPRLFGIAYRILGSAPDAEDVVQDTWLRWSGRDRTDVRDPEAFLVVTATRLALTQAQSAHVRREAYVGPWFPTPVDTESDPQLGAERRATLELAVLHVLQRLGPAERAAYVLREAFGHPYDRIAEILQMREPAVRQLVSRARRRLDGERRTTVSHDRLRSLLDAFLAAAHAGDIAGLEAVLAADVTSETDGGGVRRAARRPVVGGNDVARFVAGFSTRFWPDATVRRVQANGRPAALFLHDGRPSALLCVVADESGITQLMWVMNPDKLADFR